MKRDTIPSQEQQDMDNILSTLRRMQENRLQTEKRLEEIDDGLLIVPEEDAMPEEPPQPEDEEFEFIDPVEVETEPEEEALPQDSDQDFILPEDEQEIMDALATEETEDEAESFVMTPAMSATPEDAEVAAAEAEEAPQPEADEALPPVPVRRNPFRVLWEAFRGNLPAKGDSVGAWIRKIVFLVALLALLGAVAYIVYDVGIVPAQNARLNEELREMYQPEKDWAVTEGNYPEGMLASFQQLYDANPDVRGWISYHSTGRKDFLGIEYPVVFSGDHEKYLRQDFYLNKNKNGTLFFDEYNRVNTATDENKVLIIYGHNMASGQMFAGLNDLLGSVNNARTAAQLSLSTLFEKSDYKVFAVILSDEDEEERWYFNTRRTQFAGDKDFLGFVTELRARSLFDYPVDVSAQDELLVLSTCTAKSTSKLENGRLIVVARKVREGEETAVSYADIQKNEDVIMPRKWYQSQNLPLHEYYTKGYLELLPLGTAPTTTTTTMTTTTTTTTGSTTTTEEPTTTTKGTTTTTGSTTTTESATTTKASTTTTAKPSTPSTPVTSQPTTGGGGTPGGDDNNGEGTPGGDDGNGDDNTGEGTPGGDDGNGGDNTGDTGGEGNTSTTPTTTGGTNTSISESHSTGESSAMITNPT